MEIILANPRGFCAGVERAIKIVELAIEKYGSPIYVRHEIVHNKYVVDSLKEKGAIFVDEISDIPDAAVIIFSAHGVSKKVENDAQARNLTVIDATCPLVTKVHIEAQKYEKKNKKIILIGHRSHPEVEGTSGRINGDMIIVSSIEDVDSIVINTTNNTALAYVTQTTLSVDDTKKIIDKLKERFPDIEGPDLRDICYATQNRQNAVKILAKQVDVILVIGANNSSNSNRLRDLAIECGVNSYLICDENDLKDEWLSTINNIGITAGASAPEILVENVVNFLKMRYNASVRQMGGVFENIKFRLPIEIDS